MKMNNKINTKKNIFKQNIHGEMRFCMSHYTPIEEILLHQILHTESYEGIYC